MESTEVWRRTTAVAALLTVATGLSFGVGFLPADEATLAADDGAAGDEFGAAVAVEENTVLVGASRADSDRGAAYVMTRSGGIWTQEARLVAADGVPLDRFGSSVALDSDTAVVAAPARDTVKGAAYVFTRSGTAWTQEAVLTASGPEDSHEFGAAVAIEGDVVVVGAPYDFLGTQAVFVFTRTGTTWTKQATITRPLALAETNGNATNLISLPPSAEFGRAVALAGDSVVVGAPGISGGGAAFVFRRVGTTWAQEAWLRAPDSRAGGSFGGAVALEGDTAVVGAVGQNDGRGAAYVFTRNGTEWNLQQTLTAGDARFGRDFGLSLALKDETLVVGDSPSNSDAEGGSAFVFQRRGSCWARQAKLKSPEAADSDHFGAGVALSGGTAVVAASGIDSSRGAAFVFSGLEGEGPPPGYLLPRRVRARTDEAHPGGSTLVASGIFDTGACSPDFSGGATLDVGGFHIDIPEFVPEGRSLSYRNGGVSVRFTPGRRGASHGTFAVKVVGDLAGKVDGDGPLPFRFTNDNHDLAGTAVLAASVLVPHGVAVPESFLLHAAAAIPGGGRDVLRLRMGFATNGTFPPAEDLTLRFGGGFAETIPADSFVRDGDSWVYTSRPRGITKAVVDHARGTVSIVGKDLFLGSFTKGANTVTVTIQRGGEEHSADIRMARVGDRLVY